MRKILVLTLLTTLAANADVTQTQVQIHPYCITCSRPGVDISTTQTTYHNITKDWSVDTNNFSYRDSNRRFGGNQFEFQDADLTKGFEWLEDN